MEPGLQTGFFVFTEAGRPRWRTVAFSNMLVDGGFRVSAVRRDGKVEGIVVTSGLGGTFHVESPWTGKTLSAALAPGAVRTLTAADER